MSSTEAMSCLVGDDSQTSRPMEEGDRHHAPPQPPQRHHGCTRSRGAQYSSGGAPPTGHGVLCWGRPQKGGTFLSI